MKHYRIFLATIAAGLALAAAAVAAQTPSQTPATERTRDQAQARTNAQEQAQAKLGDQQIYGYQLMTPAERNVYRDRMRATKTAQERERIRAEHHAEMQVRAKERGVTLPPEPPAGRRMGNGPGMGTGMGAGSGPGSGPGGGGGGGGGRGGK